jgi:DNA-binding phage protein
MVSGEPLLQTRFALLEKHLDERLRRLVAAAEAEVLRPRGISLVSRSTGVSRRAIRMGMQELHEASHPSITGQRVRKAGGGRKKAIDKDPLLADLERHVEPSTRGDQRWSRSFEQRLR